MGKSHDVKTPFLRYTNSVKKGVLNDVYQASLQGCFCSAVPSSPPPSPQPICRWGPSPAGRAPRWKNPLQELIGYLSEVTGVSIRLRYTESWLSYGNETRNDSFDITFDDAAFVSWRMQKMGHEILAHVTPETGSGQHVVVVKKDHEYIKSHEDLIARTVCGRPAPNLATLVLLKVFPNPARQLTIAASLSYDDAYGKMLTGRCEVALMGESVFASHPDRDLGRVVFTSQALPPAAITASPRVTPEQKRKIIAALTAPEAAQRIGGFLKEYAAAKPLVRAEPSVYEPHFELLKNEWGFGD